MVIGCQFKVLGRFRVMLICLRTRVCFVCITTSHMFGLFTGVRDINIIISITENSENETSFKKIYVFV